MFPKGLLIVLALLLPLAFAPLAHAAEKSSYIVVFKDSANLKGEISDLKEDSPVPRVYSNVFKGANVLLTAEEKSDLANDPSVRFIEKDGIVQATRNTSLWGLDRLDQRNRPLDGRFLSESTGRGVNAYVLDSGVRAAHQEFSGRVLPGFTSISDGRGVEDCYQDFTENGQLYEVGHGTHVAATILGTTYGVAPDAKLIPVRVLDCKGGGSWSGVIQGMDWAVAQHDPGEKSVANMSLGGNYSASVNLAVSRMTQDGITTVVAAGNENSDACLSSPASAPSAITVGSTTSTDARSWFSNKGACLDLFAPGSAILSATSKSTTASDTLSGTSMASPHVAGAAALLLENNTLTPGAAEVTLKNGASTGLVLDAGSGSPDRLLYTGSDIPPPPQPPLNDNFANAGDLTLGQTNSNNNYATMEVGEPSHVHPSSGASVWYKWTAPASGTLSLNTHESSFDTILALYTGGSVSALTYRVGNDDDASGSFGNASKISLAVVSGTTYRIALAGYGAATGNFKLNSAFVPTAQPTPPAPSLLSQPSARTTKRTATFVFSGLEGAQFSCSLDGWEWEICSSPKTYENLSLGDHSLSLRQTLGGLTSSEVIFSWRVVSISLPAAKISSAPASSTSRRARFLFRGQAGARFQCRLNSSAWASCASPKVYRNLSFAKHTFRVRQLKDGLVSPATSHSWSVRRPRR